jgi:uncharacterized membrane protein
MKITPNLILFVIFIIGVVLFLFTPFRSDNPFSLWGFALAILGIVGMIVYRFFFK